VYSVNYVRNAVGLDVLDDKERLGRGIQAFGTVVAYPRSKGEVDSVPARIRVLMDALAFMESQATGAGSGSVGAGAVQSKPAGPLVHRPQALPALGPDAELSREQAYQRAKTLTADMKLPFRANSAVTVQDLGVIKPGTFGFHNAHSSNPASVSACVCQYGFTPFQHKGTTMTVTFGPSGSNRPECTTATSTSTLVWSTYQKSWMVVILDPFSK
jgi:hypothetical protein